MSSYIVAALIGYLFFAFNGVADKYLLTKFIRHSAAYAFYIGIAGLLTFILAPLGLRMLSPENLFIAIIAGSTFTFALYFYYHAIRETSISRILPLEGGLVPVCTLILAFLTGTERLSGYQAAAFLFLVAGAILISFKKTSDGWQAKAIKNATIAAILFATSFVLSKYIYTQTNFISGLIWTRLGLAIGGLMYLIPKKFRREIFKAPEGTSTERKLLFYVSHIFGTGGGLLQSYAIAIGSVVIVNALQGVQFVFVLLLSSFLSIFDPEIIKEKITRAIIVQKLIAIILITAGLVILVK